MNSVKQFRAPRSTRGLRGRAVAAFLTSVVALLASANAASAATEHYFSGGLSPNRAFASTSAHTNVYYSQSIAANNHCAIISTGYAGYFYPTDPNQIFTGACGNGTVGFYPNATYNGAVTHGTSWNPNSQTNVSVSDAHYSW